MFLQCYSIILITVYVQLLRSKITLYICYYSILYNTGTSRSPFLRESAYGQQL
uniref:Uncharacterized protein n=1 Tax=Setaria italica TaxID=4555 RepID=K3Y0U4_SETIT